MLCKKIDKEKGVVARRLSTLLPTACYTAVVEKYTVHVCVCVW